MNSIRQRLLLLAGLFGGTGVGLGAFGAHWLGPKLAERGMTHAWETGWRYHIVHAIALLALAAVVSLNDENLRTLRWAGRCWSLGVVLFSGSLYWLALGAPRWIGPVTPLGGVILILGWVCVIAAALDRKRKA